MPRDLTEPTLGYIVTPVTWDGTDFHPILSTVAGLLEVSIQDAVAILSRIQGHDGANWVNVQVDAAGHLKADIIEIQEGMIRSYGWDGGAWRRISTDAGGDLQVDIKSIQVGQIKNYGWTGAAWQELLVTAAGHTQVDVHSLREHTDVIPMHYHDQWRKRFSRVVDAGQDYLDSDAVPAGHVAVLTNLNYWTNNASTSSITVAVRDGVDTTFICQCATPGASVPESWTGIIYLDAGDYVRVDPTGAPVGAIVYLDIHAYLMLTP